MTALIQRPTYEAVSDDELLKLSRGLDPGMLRRLQQVEELRWKIFPFLSAGFLTLVDVMGDDSSIVQAARVSYGAGTKHVSEDTTLIRYLFRHRHTTPFEMAELKFLVKTPMDSWRQWIRHRTANVNEYSTRYSVAIDEMDVTPDDAWRLQDTANKQGSSGLLVDLPSAGEVMIDEGGRNSWQPAPNGKQMCEQLGREEKEFHRIARQLYETRLGMGVAREQARKDLPLSTYTLAYWKIDLHNLLHFLGLRMDPHAQWEIRKAATIMGEEIIRPLFPAVWSAFERYRMQATFLSGPATQILQAMKLFSGDPDFHRGGEYTQAAYEQAVSQTFPDWLKRDDSGALKTHREREEVRAVLQKLGLLQA